MTSGAVRPRRTPVLLKSPSDVYLAVGFENGSNCLMTICCIYRGIIENALFPFGKAQEDFFVTEDGHDLTDR